MKGIEFTDELRNAVERIIAFAVDRHVFQVDSISVYLADLNGPKRGVDKVCQITANLTRGNPVLILEDLGAGKYNLIYDDNGAAEGYTIVANIQTTGGSFTADNVGVQLASA